MAQNVTGQVVGSPAKTFNDVDTIADLATLMGLGDSYSVKINNVEASYTSSLSDFNFVSFGEKVKGGAK